jgi:hypothetical protein
MDSQCSLRSLKDVLAAMAAEGTIPFRSTDAVAHLRSGDERAALWIARAPNPKRRSWRRPRRSSCARALSALRDGRLARAGARKC